MRLLTFFAAVAALAQVHSPAPVAPRDFAVMAWGGSPSRADNCAACMMPG